MILETTIIDTLLIKQHTFKEYLQINTHEWAMWTMGLITGLLIMQVIKLDSSSRR